MRFNPFAYALLGLALGACSPSESTVAEPPADAPPAAMQPAATQSPAASLKSGEQVYQSVCMACHATGVANAPKSGDGESWRELESEGQAAVTAHGWVGVRGMPPRGGQPDLTLEEFARAVAWMARNSGVNWQDPDAAMLDQIRVEETKRIEALAKKTPTGDPSSKP